MLHSDKQASFLPGVLKIQRLEVVSQTAFSVTNDCHKTKVLQLFILIQRSFFALEDDSHVELLDHQVHHLSRRRGCAYLISKVS